MQDDFEKLYAGIQCVSFNEENGYLIEKIHQKFGGTTEDIELYDSVLAEGAIEIWLTMLTDEMVRSIRQECKEGQQSCNSGQTLREFVYSTCS